MGHNYSLKNLFYTLLFSIINLIISFIVYHCYSKAFIVLCVCPIVISIICIRFFVDPRKLILFCMIVSLLVVAILCGIGLFIGSMNEIAAMVIVVYHLLVNTIPYLLIMLFLRVFSYKYRKSNNAKEYKNNTDDPPSGQ